VSVVVLDPSSGGPVRVGQDAPVRSASVVKLLVYQARLAAGPLTAAGRADAAAMIERSDNAATTRLWRQAGGAPALVREARRLGLTSSGPAPVLLEPWDGWRTTAGDLVHQLSRLVGSPAPADRTLVGLMEHVRPDQAWGVGRLAAPGAVAVKNGWVPVPGHGWVVSSMGCVRPDRPHPVCLAVTSTGNASFSAGVRLVDAVSEAAYSAAVEGTES
jgi:beta-lactamase class A